MYSTAMAKTNQTQCLTNVDLIWTERSKCREMPLMCRPNNLRIRDRHLMVIFFKCKVALECIHFFLLCSSGTNQCIAVVFCFCEIVPITATAN